jgi:hypothetical protein
MMRSTAFGPILTWTRRGSENLVSSLKRVAAACDVPPSQLLADPDSLRQRLATVSGESGELNATFIHSRQHHWGLGKELWSVTLEKGSCRRTDAYNEVGRLGGEERAEIRDERYVRVLIAGTGRHQRMVKDVQLPRRLSLQLVADGSGIFAPRLEIAAKRMQDHYPLGIGRGGPSHANNIVRTKSNPAERRPRAAVPAGTRAGPVHYNLQFRHRTLRSLSRLARYW